MTGVGKWVNDPEFWECIKKGDGEECAPIFEKLARTRVRGKRDEIIRELDKCIKRVDERCIEEWRRRSDEGCGV